MHNLVDLSVLRCLMYLHTDTHATLLLVILYIYYIHIHNLNNGMARPGVAGGRYGLHIWRAPVKYIE
jgi:hypothetical protein